jgi:glutaredoxin 3
MTMTQITIYTTSICPYCARAKHLLAKKGASFKEIDVTYDASERERMMARAGGRRSVPQIFIGETHIGGCDDLHALDAKGGLDVLLVSA